MTTTSTTTTTTTTSTQPPYSTDTDLLDRRPGMLSYGVQSWESYHSRSKELVNADIEAGWYRQASAIKGLDFRVTPFDPTKILDPTVLKDLSVFKVLELAYEYLSKDAIQDVFFEWSKLYGLRYTDELNKIITRGINYDWTVDGVIDSDEKSFQRYSRRVTRC